MKVTHPVLVPNNCSEPRLPADDGAFAVPHHTPREGVGQSLQPFVDPENLVDPVHRSNNLTNLFLTYIPAGGAGCHSLGEEKEERGEFRCPARVCNNL